MILGLASGAVALCYLLAPGTCPFLSFVLLISSPLAGQENVFGKKAQERLCVSQVSPEEMVRIMYKRIKEIGSCGYGG